MPMPSQVGIGGYSEVSGEDLASASSPLCMSVQPPISIALCVLCINPEQAHDESQRWAGLWNDCCHITTLIV